MNRALRRISLASLVLFVLLLLNANYVQAFEANSMTGDPGNGRTFSQQFQYQRGAIVTSDNKTIAESLPVKGIYKYQRYYPYRAVYAPVTGFNSIYSATGIELAEDRQLSGSDPALLERCEAAMQAALGAQATAIRSQSYYLDVTPPGCDKGTFVQATARRLGIETGAVATIGDMHNDVAMFKVSGVSFAMGNASDEIKRQATHVTASNEEEGFAKAIEMILRDNQPG